MTSSDYVGEQPIARPPMIVTERGVTLILEGKSHTIAASHPNFEVLKDAIRRESWAEVRELATVEEALKNYVKGNIHIRDGKIYYLSPFSNEEEELEGYVVDKILQFMTDGLDPEPLVNFLSKVMENTSYRVISGLYEFLSNKNMPIDPDGDFYGYKAIRRDWTDKYTGKLPNHIGQVVKQDRRLVDDNPEHSCSKGLHVGSIQYVRAFAHGDDRIIIVKVNPADVVSVPQADNTKLRCCRYEIISEYQGLLPDTTFEQGQEVRLDDVGEDEDWDDDDWEEDVETCGDCGRVLDNCNCEYCEYCGELFDNCYCDDEDEEDWAPNLNTRY